MCVCRRRWYARLVGPRYGCRCNGQSAVYLLDYYRACLCVCACLVAPSDGPPSIGGSHSYFLDVTPFRTTTIILSSSFVRKDGRLTHVVQTTAADECGGYRIIYHSSLPLSCHHRHHHRCEHKLANHCCQLLIIL